MSGAMSVAPIAANYRRRRDRRQRALTTIIVMGTSATGLIAFRSAYCGLEGGWAHGLRQPWKAAAHRELGSTRIEFNHAVEPGFSTMRRLLFFGQEKWAGLVR